jgi:tetratricopeptide (TPR) repeat protein
VYQSVAAPQRETIHRAAYDHFKRQDGLPQATRLPQMAFHAARGGLKEEAGRLYLELGNRTLARHSYLDAELYYKTAMENLPDVDNDGHIAAARGRGLMRFRLGRYEDAAKDLSLALDRARTVGARLAQVELLLDQGIALDWANDYVRAAAVVAEAEELSKVEAPPPSAQARLLMGLGRTAYRKEQLPEAVALLEQAVAAAEPLGDDGYEAYTQSLMMVCFALTNMGKFEEARVISDKTLAFAESHNDPMLAVGVLQNRGLLYFLLGRTEELITDYRRCIQVAREFGFPMSEGMATKDLGELCFYMGKPQDSEPLARRAVELYAMTLGETAPRVAYSEILLARARAYQGDVEGARKVVESVTVRMEKMKVESGGTIVVPPDGQALLDVVALWLRGADDAEFDKVIEHARSINLQPPDVVEILEFKALSAQRTGRRADGLRMLEEAYAEAEKNAKVLTDRLRRQIEQATALAAS